MSDQESNNKRIVPFMAPIYDGLADYAYTILRIGGGLIFVPFGYAKLFGGRFEGAVKFFTKIGLEPASALVTYVGMVEFFGGLAVAVGLLTRPIAGLMTINMLVVVFYVYWEMAWGRIAFPLLWAVVMLVIFIRGGQRYSVDSRLGWEF